MYLQKSDLFILLYPEIIDTITRADDTLVQTALDIATAEAKTYLTRFNLIALFGGYSQPDAVTGTITPLDPSVIDQNLKSKVLDLAAWQLIKLCNPNIDIRLFRTSYEDAIAWFKNVQKSALSPDGWVYESADPATTFPNGLSIWGITNLKRQNQW